VRGGLRKSMPRTLIRGIVLGQSGTRLVFARLAEKIKQPAQ
jgi:hypothetical protein